VDKTYGYYRVGVLAALVNGILLLGVSGYILYEAYGRFTDPPDVSSVPLLLVASVGLAVNLASAAILMSGAKESLNVRGAFLEVAGDLLGSLGAITAGVILLTTGWRYSDALFAAGVGLFILPRTFRLMKEAVDVLLEGTPRGMEFDEVAEAMAAVPDIQSVHDLHIWSVTSGFVVLSGHVDVPERADRQQVLAALHRVLTGRFDIDVCEAPGRDRGSRAGTPPDCLPESAELYRGAGHSAAWRRRGGKWSSWGYRSPDQSFT